MSASESWLDALPPDFYAQLTHTLDLYGMAALELLSRPVTPATARLHQLTSLDVATVQRLNGIGSHPQPRSGTSHWRYTTYCCWAT